MDKDQLIASFQQLGYSSNDFLTSSMVQTALNKLNGNAPFDEFIFQELWGECRENSLGQVRLGEFVDVIMRAKRAIVEQNGKVIANIGKLLQEKKELQVQSEKQGDRARREIEREIDEINGKIREEKENKEDYNRNLQILDRLFAQQPKPSSNVKSPSKQYKDFSLPNPNLQAPEEQYNDLRCILLLTIPMIIAECILMFQKTDFLNVPILLTQLLFYCFVLMIFIIVNVDQVYIRVTLGILVLSVVTDILWVFVHAGKLWSTQAVGEYPKTTETFRRVVLVSTLGLMAGKLFIGALLLRYRNVEGVLKIKWRLTGPQTANTIANSKPGRNFVTSAIRKVRPEPALVI